MPQPLTYPGVYIEEVPSGVRTITGVATSITAFVGRTVKGPLDEPVRVQSYAEFERRFGGLWRASPLSYAVSHYFAHGGSDALIVRVATDEAAAATAMVGGGLELTAASKGEWANGMEVVVEHAPDSTEAFNLILNAPDGTEERHLNLSVAVDAPRSVAKVLEARSALARVSSTPASRPTEDSATFSGGQNGGEVGHEQIAAPDLAADRKGIYALDKADLFNLLCIPPYAPGKDVSSDTWAAAAGYCKDQRAVLVVDPPAGWTDVAAAESGVGELRSAIGTANATNAAVYFPRLEMADPLQENRTGEFVPCGAVAGVMARTDAQRGVWKAPAGLEASLVGVRALTYRLTDAENGRLNPLGLNCLRTFPVSGRVVWGARTLAGADQLASEWKYLPVRRLALFIEESLYRGTQWVVFEPNDEPLWAQIRLNVGAFMQDLFRQGAFQGRSPREAYFVKCDGETTTQADIDRGIVNILVGFAPLKPAEFVVIRIQQIAGEIQT